MPVAATVSQRLFRVRRANSASTCRCPCRPHAPRALSTNARIVWFAVRTARLPGRLNTHCPRRPLVPSSSQIGQGQRYLIGCVRGIDGVPIGRSSTGRVAGQSAPCFRSARGGAACCGAAARPRRGQSVRHESPDRGELLRHGQKGGRDRRFLDEFAGGIRENPARSPNAVTADRYPPADRQAVAQDVGENPGRGMLRRVYSGGHAKRLHMRIGAGGPVPVAIEQRCHRTIVVKWYPTACSERMKRAAELFANSQPLGAKEPKRNIEWRTGPGNFRRIRPPDG